MHSLKIALTTAKPIAITSARFLKYLLVFSFSWSVLLIFSCGERKPHGIVSFPFPRRRVPPPSEWRSAAPRKALPPNLARGARFLLPPWRSPFFYGRTTCFWISGSHTPKGRVSLRLLRWPDKREAFGSAYLLIKTYAPPYKGRTVWRFAIATPLSASI